MGEVIRALHRIRPGWRTLVRTKAPRQMLPDGIEFSTSEFESNVHERRTGVVMDEQATHAHLRTFLNRWDTVLADEIAFVREQRASLIVSDIPAIAGDVAHGIGIPCIAISNFTWDWIFEPYATAELVRLQEGYSRMSALLRLPFYQPSRLDIFPRMLDAPLIARKATGAKNPNASKIRVLLGSRAQVSSEALARATASAPDFTFVTPTESDRFSDLLASCDVVIAKLGFSMLAECIAAGKRLLYPPRENFREEILLQQHVHEHVVAEPIPLGDFYRGDWGAYLRAIWDKPPVFSSIRTDGAEFCAEYLAEWPFAS